MIRFSNCFFWTFFSCFFVVVEKGIRRIRRMNGLDELYCTGRMYVLDWIGLDVLDWIRCIGCIGLDVCMYVNIYRQSYQRPPNDNPTTYPTITQPHTQRTNYIIFFGSFIYKWIVFINTLNNTNSFINKNSLIYVTT